MENLIAKATFAALVLAAGWSVLGPAAEATGKHIDQTNRINCQQAAGWGDELAKNGLRACQ